MGEGSRGQLTRTRFRTLISIALHEGRLSCVSLLGRAGRNRAGLLVRGTSPSSIIVAPCCANFDPRAIPTSSGVEIIVHLNKHECQESMILIRFRELDSFLHSSEAARTLVLQSGTSQRVSERCETIASMHRTW